MGNCALLMRSLGHEVFGADHAFYAPMSERLEESGIPLFQGYDAERLAGLDADLVVVGNVNTRGNPEIEWLLQSGGVPFVSLPELLYSEVLRHRKRVVVAGTHGKTTTTTLAAHMLRSNGIEAGYFVGGVPVGFSGGAELGHSTAPFVIEGDEYDCAFFDKRSKFIHYRPDWLILNNLEFDHADIFRDLQDIERSFAHLIKLVPSKGGILVNSDDPNLEKLICIDWAPVYRIGLGKRADLRIVNFTESDLGSEFDLVYRGKNWGHVRWPVWGLFNARNAAMAVLATAFSSGIPDPTELSLESLSFFKGVRRRQEILYDKDGLTVMLDFGHHPTAIRQTLDCLRARYPRKQLIMCFEARSNTSCRSIHASEFEIAFDLADEVHLGAVYRAERYSDTERLDLEGIAERLGTKATAHLDNTILEEYLFEHLPERKNAICVFFSNGSFDRVPQQLVEHLEEHNTGCQSEVRQ